jgi:hypothetical protein
LKAKKVKDIMKKLLEDLVSSLLPVEIYEHFSVKGKPLYLKICRRRWKESGESTHYSNSYELHPEGVKATHEFASF